MKTGLIMTLQAMSSHNKLCFDMLQPLQSRLVRHTCGIFIVWNENLLCGNVIFFAVIGNMTPIPLIYVNEMSSIELNMQEIAV